ncbi:MAG: peptidoglycan DD-metalloendopeptidase family protein [Megasphaera sp.]|jgi:murein DD-endopeptidase MepM/ murein hydrolase activator NlpD|nr:peptidoglycan DD-metalloendopeptidase family protein [Megasphaera sp.]MCH4188248.1 peptidoglycan DD-metalloendopeptidase family protein [Megasphaera sp.]MCH4217308.1 peptidoglycan DD-metalloendopeptidase family protein [Megasphaera sp.]
MMQFKSQKKYIAAIITATLLSPSFAVFAEDEDLQNQLSDVQGRMAEQAQKKNDAEAVIGNVFEKLRVIQENLDGAVKDYKELASQLADTDQKISSLQKELDQKQAKLTSREGVFSKRVRDIYMHGQLSYIDVVLGAKNFDDFANRVELLRRIVDSDMELITSIRDERDQITAAKQTLETEREKQAKLKDDAAKKKDEIEQHKGEQQGFLRQAQNDKATAQEAYDELESASQSIGEMLRQRAADRANAQAQASAGSSDSGDGSSSDGGSYDSYQPVSGSGAMIWPVNGVITSPFGYREHPIFGRAILHSGIDIGVDYGTPVHAADSGVVVDAGWISGYGYAVVIDHGNGLSTLYGHNESLAVSSGQSVSQGQVIAYAGSTGNSTGPHVHFEVRSNGDPVDPSAYL